MADHKAAVVCCQDTWTKKCRDAIWEMFKSPSESAYRQAQDPKFDTRSRAVRRKAKARLSQPCGRAITSGSGSLLVVVVRAFAAVCSTMSTGGCPGRILSGTPQVSMQGHAGYDSLSCAVSGFWTSGYVWAVGRNKDALNGATRLMHFLEYAGAPAHRRVGHFDVEEICESDALAQQNAPQSRYQVPAALRYQLKSLVSTSSQSGTVHQPRAFGFSGSSNLLCLHQWR
ncbi:hypothetical protein J1614_001632 [Plenodomus biglobosus]|nr:hypothetical protein J1614_001632 [Plenodomus biglobosus]